MIEFAPLIVKILYSKKPSWIEIVNTNESFDETNIYSSIILDNNNVCLWKFLICREGFRYNKKMIICWVLNLSLPFVVFLQRISFERVGCTLFLFLLFFCPIFSSFFLCTLILVQLKFNLQRSLFLSFLFLSFVTILYPWRLVVINKRHHSDIRIFCREWKKPNGQYLFRLIKLFWFLSRKGWPE